MEYHMLIELRQDTWNCDLLIPASSCGPQRGLKDSIPSRGDGIFAGAGAGISITVAVLLDVKTLS